MAIGAERLTAAAEAVLFAVGEPLELSKLAKVLGLDRETCSRVLLDLSGRLDESGSGVRLLKLGERYQLCSRAEYAAPIRAILEVRRDLPLSQAAFEALAVIAYNQPVTKAFVEQVRGVDCSGVISTLCQKKLIEEKGRLELPGRPLVYGTTPDFLRCFGLSSLSELPELPDREDARSEAAAGVPQGAGEKAAG